MDNELEVIRTQMEQTRSSLSDKLEALEGEFRGTVQGATNAVETVQETVASVTESVQETVQNVKDSVKETVETVKDSLDVRKHVERHPWAMFGGAFMVGCFAGYLVGGRRRKPSKPAAVEAVATPAETPFVARNGNSHHNGASRKKAESSTSNEDSGFLQAGLQKLKGLAVGTLMGVLRDAVVGAVPSNLAPDLVRVVDDMTTKLGGQPLRHDEGTNEYATRDDEGGSRDDESDSSEVGRPVGAARWAR